MATEQSELSVLISGRDTLSPTLSQMESKLIRFVGAVSSAVAAVKLITLPVVSASNFEREMANVTKTTQFTKSQIDSLGEAITDMSLRLNVSAIDLAKIAAAAGQQGLGREGVEGIRIFTESVARMSSVLDISADQAASDIGKVLNIFRISIKESERVSSAFNQVSNNSTAKGSQLLDIVKRIGDAGGSLKLDQSIALAATGLDLGLNPEVIGTSYTKIFAKFRTSSKEFGALVFGDMKDAQSKWLDIATTDGVKALNLYTSALRNKGAADQAQIVARLSGQGRIYGQLLKSVQDTENRIIDRNTMNATEGFTSGLSSLREQATVLNTVNAQVEILGNSLSKLGNDAATPLLGELKSTIADLSEGLQSDGVKSFVSALITSFGQLFTTIRNGVQWLASLNVNWSNFLVVAKVFLAIKFGEALIAILTRLPGVSAGLQLIAKSSIQAGQAGVQAAIAEGTAIDVLKAKRLELLAAKETAFLAEREMQIAAMRLDAARTAAVPLQQAIRPLATAAATNNIAAAEAEARRQAVAAEGNAKIAASTVQHEARMNAIRANYAGQRRVAQVAARDAEILAEEQFYARSQRSLTAHNSRKLVQAEQAAASALALQAETNAKLLEAQAAYAAKSREIGAAQAAALASTTAAGAAGAAAANASVGFGVWAAAMGRWLIVASRFLITAALWVTILYTIADALGLIDKAGSFITNLADRIGLTSKKTAELAEEARKAQEAWRKHRLEVDEVTQAYGRLLDATGRVRPTLIKDQLKSLKEETRPEVRQRTLTEVLNRTSAADTIKSEASTAKSDILNPTAQGVRLADLTKQLDTARVAMSTANAGLASVGASETAFTRQVRAVQTATNEFDRLTKEVAKQRNLLDIAQKASPAGIQDSIDAKGFNYSAEQERNVQLVTANSKVILEQIGLPLVQARKELADTTAKITKQGTIAGNVDDPATKEKQRQQDVSTAELTALQAAATARVSALERKLLDAQNSAASPGEKAAAVVAGEIAAAATVETLPKFLTSLNSAQKAGAKFGDGSNLGVPEPDAPATGDDPATPTSKELSEAQKLAKARAELAVKGADDEVKLAKVAAEDRGRINQEQYEQGLIDLNEYYSKAEALDLAAIAADRARTQNDIASRQIEKSQLTKESDRVRVQAEINSLQNDLKIQDAQSKNVTAATTRAIANAKRTFDEGTASDQLALARYFGIEQVQDFFNNQFGVYMAEARVKIAQLKASIAANPDDPTGNATKERQITDIGDQNRMKAYSDTMAEFAKRTALAESAYSRFTQSQQVQKLQGQVTDQDIAAAELVARSALLTAMRDEISQRTKLLPTANAGTIAYKQEAEAIEALKLQYNQLAVSADATANAVNNAVESSIAAALKEIQLSGGKTDAQRQSQLDIDAINATADAQKRSLQNMRDERARMSVQSIATSNIDQQIAAGNKALDDLQQKASDVRKKNAESDLNEFISTLKKMASSIASTMLDIINKNIAQNLVKSVLGGGGNGGIGGWFSDIMSGSNGTPKGSKSDPLYVTDISKSPVDAALSGNPVDAVQDTMMGSVKKKVKDTFDTLVESVSTSLGSFGKFFSSTLQSIFASMSGGGGGGGILGSLVQFGVGYFTGGGMRTFDVSAGTATGGADLGNLDWMSGIHHTGGIIGSPSNTRAVNPAVFTEAMRYHTGGLVGLRPDEVPLIGQRGEEMLTANDPRHRNNGGLASGTADGSEVTNNNVTVNVTVTGSEASASDPKSKELGKAIASAVQSEIVNQKRPGGLLA